MRLGGDNSLECGLRVGRPAGQLDDQEGFAARAETRDIPRRVRQGLG
jgi:hypothetical protein